jgi:GT2 family glycosyltransferase
MNERKQNQELSRSQMMKEALAKKPSNGGGIPVGQLLSQVNGTKQPATSNKVVTQRSVRGRRPNKFPNNTSRPNKVGVQITRKPFVPPDYRVHITPDWFTKDENVDVSIIVPCYKSRTEIAEQIKSWDLANDGLTKEIIYVDDCCPQKTYQGILEAWEARKGELSGPVGKIVFTGRNAGFANACNSGFKVARGKYVVFLNADTTVTPNWIKPMYDCLQNEEIGIVGNLHLRHDDVIDSCGSEWDWGQGAFLHAGKHIWQKKHLSRPFRLSNAPAELLTPHEVEMVTGACIMLPSILFQKIKGFDTEYRIGYWEDADLCMRIHAHGKKVFFTPDSKIFHKGGHTHTAAHAFMSENRNLFHRKWVATKIIQGYLDENRAKKPDFTVDPKSVVVYTAITNRTNDYDNLKEQPPTSRGVDFVAFLEAPIESKTWECRQINKGFPDPNRNAKIHKILPHKYFPDKLYSLWIDGSVTIEFPFSVEKLIELYLSDSDMALFKHSERHCIYQEANVCMQRRLDDPNVIREQIQRYTKDGHPSNAGLGECTILLRRHTDQIKEFNEAWWKEIQNGSKRDQISFAYLTRKMGIKFRYFPGHLRAENYLFHRDFHKKQTRK